MKLSLIKDSLYETQKCKKFKFYLNQNNLILFYNAIFQEKQIIIFSSNRNSIIIFT
jgi:hypothetical protein